MNKLLIFFIVTSIFGGGCKNNNDNRSIVQQQKNEYWANYDDLLDIKSEATIDTVLFRKEMNQILTPEKIFELFGSGYHNFYFALTISKNGQNNFTIAPDISLWLCPGLQTGDMIFSEGTDLSIAKNKSLLTNHTNEEEIRNHAIFNTPFTDVKNIFKTKPGILNGKSVRSIKLFEMNITIDKKQKIVKPWTIKEIDVSKYREHFLNPKLNRYYFSTGLPAVSVDGFESIRKAIIYPDEAEKNSITGRVIVEIFADEEGKYAGYQLIKGLGYGCDEAVIEAIQKAKFRGYPTGQRSSIIVPFEFGPPKTSPIDLAVQVFDYNQDPNVYNNIKLGIVNKNKLDKNLEQNYFIYVYMNGYLIFQNYCTGISKAETQQFFWFRWHSDKPGSYNYTIYIDPENRLNDSNRENNTVRGTLVVK
ncbi:MAG: TonB family protein [Ignavibacteriales bacterium]|nr:TonB family protein [Ignavibacteriales bacterium]